MGDTDGKEAHGPGHVSDDAIRAGCYTPRGGSVVSPRASRRLRRASSPALAPPHTLRHTYGRNAVLNGVPTPVLQKWLGHHSLAETERYVELAGGHHDWVKRV